MSTLYYLYPAAMFCKPMEKEGQAQIWLLPAPMLWFLFPEFMKGVVFFIFPNYRNYNFSLICEEESPSLSLFTLVTYSRATMVFSFSSFRFVGSYLSSYSSCSHYSVVYTGVTHIRSVALYRCNQGWITWWEAQMLNNCYVVSWPCLYVWQKQLSMGDVLNLMLSTTGYWF